MFRFFRHGGTAAWALIGAVVLTMGASAVLLANTMDVRFRRDVSRMVFNDNVGVLDDIRKLVGSTDDSLSRVLAASPQVAPAERPYVVVSIEDHRLWYKKGDTVLFTTRVATGSGKTLEREGGLHWRFETPRGRLIVESKEQDPQWVPPDWHFVEQATRRGLGVVQLRRGEALPAPDGTQITISGNNVVRRYPDGHEVPIESGEGKEIVIGGNLVIPPFGTNQRKFAGVLGTHRLNLGDGYGIHGTDAPESIGRSVSHGCIRVRNEDIETLYRIVPVGTPVYIY